MQATFPVVLGVPARTRTLVIVLGAIAFVAGILMLVYGERIPETIVLGLFFCAVGAVLSVGGLAIPATELRADETGITLEHWAGAPVTVTWADIIEFRAEDLRLVIHTKQDAELLAQATPSMKTIDISRVFLLRKEEPTSPSLHAASLGISSKAAAELLTAILEERRASVR